MRAPGRRFIFVLDALVLVFLLVLLSPQLTGLALHEWIGIALVAPVLLHLLLSWRWISAATRRLFSGAPRQTRINYVINVALFVLVVLEVVSGVGISRAALPTLGIATIDDRSWRALHNLALHLLEFLTAMHIAMNWRWIAATASRAFRRGAGAPPREVRVLPAAARGAGRSAVIALCAAVVAGAIVAWLGLPSPLREYTHDEFRKFSRGPVHGLVQISGMTLLIFGAAYVGRRWLRVRL